MCTAVFQKLNSVELCHEKGKGKACVPLWRKYTCHLSTIENNKFEGVKMQHVFGPLEVRNKQPIRLYGLEDLLGCTVP